MINRWNIELAITLAIAILIISACSSKSPFATTAEPAPAPGIATSQVPLKEAWEVEWENLAKAAKREGTVVFYTTMGPQPARGIADAFKTTYGVAAEVVLASGGQLSTRILAERRAGVYTADVFSGGLSTMVTNLKPQGAFDKLEPVLTLPELTVPEQIKTVWWSGQLLWSDTAHYILASQAGSQTPVAINTDLVKGEEVKSYRDLLAPKLKEKIIMMDPTVAGFSQNWITAAGELFLGWDYVRELAMQKPFLTRDERLAVDWLAHGKYLVSIGVAQDTIAEFMAAGASVRINTPRGASSVSTASSNASLMNKAPHPNAARLFINWLFTREPQSVWSRKTLYPSLRLDIPTDYVDPQRLIYRNPGEEYFIVDQEEFQIRRQELLKQALEIFGPMAR